MDIRRAIPVLASADLAASRRFYVDLLGFEIAMDEPGFLMLRSGSVPTTQVIVATTDATDRQVRNVDISIEVDDLDQAYREAVDQGWEIVYPPTEESWGIRRFFLRDPDGTVVNVASHISVPSDLASAAASPAAPSEPTAPSDPSEPSELALYLTSAVDHAEETYRRIEAELHGGPGQRLVSLALELRLISAGLPAGGEEERRIAQVIAHLSETAADLRSIEQRIFPPIVVDAGIGAGLRSLSRRASVPVEVELATDRRYPPAVELAVYRAIAAALEAYGANGAERVAVRASGVDERMVLTVTAEGVESSPSMLSTALRAQIVAAGGLLRLGTGPGSAGFTVEFVPTVVKNGG
jgi:catechol 2,3-dioxygenase-like lactoylglutathione lyase family enzyme